MLRRFRGAMRAIHQQRYSCTVVPLPRLADFGVANEPVLDYRRGSSELIALSEELCCASSCIEDVPIVIGGKEIREGTPRFQVMPHDYRNRIAQYYYASEKTIQHAIAVTVDTQKRWDRVPIECRIAVWEAAADLMSTVYRQMLNAATMLGQSKTIMQAEFDSACELIDLIRFNNYFLKERAKYQPISTRPAEILNSIRFRGIDGFIAAISPFTSTAIAGNLAYTPALMGNGVIWKPSDTAILSNWRIFNIMREAGVPDGVVNFVPADPLVFGKTVTSSCHLAGVNFTGTVPSFKCLWTAVAQNLNKYRNFPRLVGECGAKNFHFVHSSADVGTVVSSTIRAAFEFAGQNCSACSRLYVPKSMFCFIMEGLIRATCQLGIGDPTQNSIFMGAVIDETAFDRTASYIKAAKKNSKNTIHAGGEYDKSKGYFVMPTIIETCDPHDKLLTDEILGPILTVYQYDDRNVYETLELVESSTAYALSGSIFAQDPCFIETALEMLKYAAGNLYVNDKSTGAIVGQQPFSGGHMSGCNDKSGGPNYVLRWASPQSIKEKFVPHCDIYYPYMCD